MPRKISINEKRGWLEEYEKGRPEASIATKNRRDVRTVKKGIEDARREQDLRFARSELLKEALRKHQDRLEVELRGILNTIKDPPEDFAPLPWYHNGDSIFSPVKPQGEVSEYIKPSRAGRKPADQSKTPQDLLRQHLRNDKVWKLFAQWEEIRRSHLADRTALQLKVVALLEEKTGYNLVDKNDISPPFLYSYIAGDLFFRAVLSRAFGTKGIANLEAEIRADTASGAVKYQGSILAETPGNEEICRQNLLAAFKELVVSPEVSQVVISHRSLKEASAKVRQATEEILLLGIIPGQCSICLRLGL
jgi:hypothetical protein